MLRGVALVRSDVSEELSTSIIRVTRIGKLGKTLVITALSTYETAVLTRATRRNIPEDAILYSHRHENLKSYKTSIVRQQRERTLQAPFQQGQFSLQHVL
jgi:hypothetical protein